MAHRLNVNANTFVPVTPPNPPIPTRAPPKKKNRHALHSRAWRREQCKKKELADNPDKKINEPVLPPPSPSKPKPSSSSFSSSSHPRPDYKIPLSSSWDLPDGLHPRAWTSVSSIGRGAEWGTARVQGYGGIMYSDPRPITTEEAEVDYVVEKGYRIREWMEAGRWGE